MIIATERLTADELGVIKSSCDNTYKYTWTRNGESKQKSHLFFWASH